MAEAAVSSLLAKVELILMQPIDLGPHTETELRELKDELASLKASLEDAAKNQKDETFRKVESQVTHMVCEAEDTIDACVTADIAAGKAKNSCYPCRRMKKINTAEKVKSLREEKVKQIMEQVKTLNPNGSGISVGQPSARVNKVSTIREDNLVGFEDEEEIVIHYLLEATEELDVISIVGRPGLGKTTLALKIFRNMDIRSQFPSRIWVHVSHEFNKRDVLLDILKALTFEDMSGMSDTGLAHAVRAFLDRQKFLLVLDDVWTVEIWRVIRDLLPINNWRGKVLITSRQESVGTEANVARKPHQLRILTEEESWKLLQLEIFGSRPCPPQLERLGRRLAEQCFGLPPLATVVIGGILVDLFARKRAMSEIVSAWHGISENLITYVKNSKDNNNISDIVELSYNSLPYYLKRCFLYLPVFPEDYQIPVWTLTRLWIAEGFILDQGQGLEKAAEDNLKDLINRNLVMVGEKSPNAQVKTCRVHNVIRDFCISKAALLEENFVQEFKMSAEHHFFVPPVSDIQKYRHLSVHSHLSDFLKQIAGTECASVRSFLCFGKVPVLLDEAYISTIPDAFDLLRVLDSKSFKFGQFPIKVTRLIHLKYITLDLDDLNVLPQDISKLWNLQTLVVETQCPTLQMEADISKMIQLRHLKTKAAIVLAAKAEGKGGENLQTLSRLSPDDRMEEVFAKGCNLKRLGIRGCLDIISKSTSLAVLECLETLKLMNYIIGCKPNKMPMDGLPAAEHFPPNLKRLTLSATYLGWEHMSILGKIPNLQVLKLKQYAFIGRSWTVDGGFDALQFLLIETTDLVEWNAPDDQFRSLTCLVLKNCFYLKEIPLGLAKSLQILEIERDIPKSAVESAKKIEATKGMQESEKHIWGEFKLRLGLGCE